MYTRLRYGTHRLYIESSSNNQRLSSNNRSFSRQTLSLPPLDKSGSGKNDFSPNQNIGYQKFPLRSQTGYRTQNHSSWFHDRINTVPCAQFDTRAQSNQQGKEKGKRNQQESILGAESLLGTKLHYRTKDCRKAKYKNWFRHKGLRTNSRGRVRF
jgi:hypothetical protein